MPNRIIKESICSSDRLNELTDFQFRLWVGLLVTADDAGRGDARPAIIRGKVFPLRDRLSLRDVEDALQALAAHGCVSCYRVGGKPYYAFPTWGIHQRLDRAKPKYPAPEEADQPMVSHGESRWNSVDDSGSPQFAADCGNLPQTAADCGLNTNTNTNSNTNTKEKGKGTRNARFAPPTVEEVQEYVLENGYSVDAERFVAYYTSNGWKVGKNAMKDWRATVRGWATRDKTAQKDAVKSNPALNYAQREYKDEDFRDDFFFDVNGWYRDNYGSK